MPEEEKIFSSKMKYDGIFTFKDFYKFCYDWLKDETGLDIIEQKYEEKLSGNSKNVEVKWEGTKKVTDYFKFKIGIEFKIIGLKNVEINKTEEKIETNKGSVEVKVSGTLIRDYEGKWDKDAIRKFLRGIYEKWVITSRVDLMEEKLVGNCDDFLSQAKSYLDLEGKR